LLNDCLHLLAPLRQLEPTGKADANTVGAIKLFQERVLKMPKPDGRVDPNGTTLRALVANAKNASPFQLSSGPEKRAATTVRFPLNVRPVESYREGMRRFGARRKGGRLHAGCDLYADVGAPILALDSGEVLMFYEFYLGTFALEVRHPNFIARYGEIKQALPPGIKAGAKVARGQTIAYVGQLKGLNMSMLHLELYSGSGSGRLTSETGPYKRRGDLIDPTLILDGATTT
jgi:murein DD-endopeptidase MepM/ murein hydrolase activator NlpD